MTIRILSTFCSLLISAFLISGCAHRVEKASDWYETDPMAKKLSQLLPEEIELLDGSGLLHHKPVILPKPEYVVSGNDYFDS